MTTNYELQQRNLKSAMDSILKATVELSKMTSRVDEATSQLAALHDQIAEADIKLASRAAEIDETFRRTAAELSLRVVENANDVLSTLMSERGLAFITGADLAKLKAEFDEFKAGAADAQTAAVGQAVASKAAEFSIKLKDAESRHAIETAELKANTNSLLERMAFLQKDNDSLRAQITAEREARISIAQAEATRQGVVVNTGK